MHIAEFTENNRNPTGSFLRANLPRVRVLQGPYNFEEMLLKHRRKSTSLDNCRFIIR